MAINCLNRGGMMQEIMYFYQSSLSSREISFIPFAYLSVKGHGKKSIKFVFMIIKI